MRKRLKQFISQKPIEVLYGGTVLLAVLLIAAGFYLAEHPVAVETLAAEEPCPPEPVHNISVTEPPVTDIWDAEVWAADFIRGVNASTGVTQLLEKTRDTEPPVISGELDKKSYIGDAIAYRRGVTVTDNRDKEVRLVVDSSDVDICTEGVYTVRYSATDSSGNQTVVYGTVTIVDVMREQVDEMADEVLADILTPDMTQRDQAYAIYTWVRNRMIYNNSRIKDNVPYAAYRGLRYGKGDCYIHYALAEVLLTRAGIGNIPIRRIAGTPTAHYWSLINVGDGWYHFDATPRVPGANGFMLTESEAEYITRISSIAGYYVYDKSLYPEVVP
jgi:hypothetical protein